MNNLNNTDEKLGNEIASYDIKNELKKIFSERFKSLTGNMNPTDIERTTGIIRQNISKYFAGTALPKLEILAVLADNFNVSYDYLLGRDDNIVYGTDYLTKETGLNKESLKILKELTLNKDNSKLFLINQLISLLNQSEFLDLLYQYQSSENDDMSNMMYYLMIKEFNNILDNIKNKK